MEEIINTEAYKTLYTLVILPFMLEFREKFQDAIKEHEQAAKVLKEFLDSFKKKIVKFYRVMFERQRTIHLERIKYLEGLSKKGSWEGIVVPPSIWSANLELEVEPGKERPLSLDNKELFQASKTNGVINQTNAPEGIKYLLGESVPFFAPKLNASLPPIVYRISHDTELLMLGKRSHWMFVKDETNTHTLYAMHSLWDKDIPTTVALLRRAGEFLPGAGAVHTSILKTTGGSFRLKMDTINSTAVTETPDRGQKTKHWSPRRFEYGGRKFVWKAEKDGGLLTKFEWETLHETKRVWPKEGSQTGKMEDETIGEKLCWGEKGGGDKVGHTIYMAAGLDQHFREHLLASQLARYIRTFYSSIKGPGGVEAAGTAAGSAAGMFSLVAAIAGS